MEMCFNAINTRMYFWQKTNERNVLNLGLELISVGGCDVARPRAALSLEALVDTESDVPIVKGGRVFKI
jgi:hypothetical protein